LNASTVTYDPKAKAPHFCAFLVELREQRDRAVVRIVGDDDFREPLHGRGAVVGANMVEPDREDVAPVRHGADLTMAEAAQFPLENYGEIRMLQLREQHRLGTRQCHEHRRALDLEASGGNGV
jgi:hypothetical protein